MLVIEKFVILRTMKGCTSRRRRWNLEVRNWRGEETENKGTGKYSGESE